MKYPKAVSTPNNKGKLPIHYAVRQGRTNVCRLLLTINPKSAFCATSKLKLPLHYAISEGYMDISKDLLQINARAIHATTSKGKIPLHFAARWGHVELIDHLLALCPHLAQSSDWENQLPLHDAAREGQVEASKRLIRAYPDGLKQKNIFNELPLFAAVRFGREKLVAEMIRWYPASGGCILRDAISNDLVHDGDWNILELCLRGAVGILKDCKHFPKVDMPKSQSSNQFNTNKDGEIYLKIAQYRDCQYWQTPPEKSNEFFHSSYDNMKLESDSEMEPLRVKRKLNDDTSVLSSPSSCDCQHDEESKALNKIGFREIQPSLNFDTERFRLGYYSQYSKSSKILESGCTAEIHKQRTFIPLHAATEISSSLPIFERILQKYTKQVSQLDQFGMLPLHIAACQAQHHNQTGVSIVYQLLKHYPDAAFIRDSLGRLPLHLALMKGATLDVVAALINVNKSSGFSPCNTKDEYRNSTPLFMAITCDCSIDVIYLLLKGDPAAIKQSYLI